MRITAALAIIITAGLVHGAWTNRWLRSPGLAAQAARLESIPKVIGGWTATESVLPAREQAMAGAAGYVARNYANAGRGVSVTVLLLCGLPGVISAHTPDVCYPGAGYTLGEISEFRPTYGSAMRPAQFRTAAALRTGTNPSALRIFWSWNDSNGWTAPENARWTFASVPVLLKLYVVRETPGASADPGDEACNDFLTLFLPEVERCLFARPSGRAPGMAVDKQACERLERQCRAGSM
jgi:hypothetical protein